MTTTNVSPNLAKPGAPAIARRTKATGVLVPRQRVLVVEDEPDARRAYSECLTDLGYLAITEASGELGIEAALRAPPDAILMDLEMPGIGGIEATLRLKSEARTRDCPIIVVSGHGATMFAQAQKAGCDAYFCKPFDAPTLDAVLRVLTVVRPIRSASAIIVKQCACGREYDRREWLALSLCGRLHVPGGTDLELRNCVCGSSIAVQSEDPGGDVPA